MIKVYIASPYTKGDVAVNVKKQLDCFAELMDKGYAPFAPLYSHFQHMAHPRPYEQWIKLDLEWVKVCDCVLRLPGESSGADGEVSYAQENNIPVYYSIPELVAGSFPKSPDHSLDNAVHKFCVEENVKLIEQNKTLFEKNQALNQELSQLRKERDEAIELLGSCDGLLSRLTDYVMDQQLAEIKRTRKENAEFLSRISK